MNIHLRKFSIKLIHNIYYVLNLYVLNLYILNLYVLNNSIDLNTKHLCFQEMLKS